MRQNALIRAAWDIQRMFSMSSEPKILRQRFNEVKEAIDDKTNSLNWPLSQPH